MDLIILLVIIAVFAGGILFFKLPAGVALAAAALAGAIAAGEYFPVRHFVEGTFGFLDPVMIIAAAMIFMKTVEATGALGTLSYNMMKYLHGYPTILMILITLFIMFPGMLTGLSSTCILTTGALVVPGLIAMGMPRPAVGALLAIASVLGMIAPPINIPVMIIGGGVDMPYIGFELPLLIATMPAALFTALYFRFRYLKTFDITEVLAQMPHPVHDRHGYKLYIPLVFVVGAMILLRVFPEYIPDVGIPFIFIIGALLGFGTGEKFNFLVVSQKAIRESAGIIAILIGVGMLVQIMTLTGVRGSIAVNALNVPVEYIYIVIILLMPAFGSAYAAASILGVPLVFVFLGHNEIIITAALSLLAGIGDMMPPPSFLCVFASKMTGVDNHYQILGKSVIPILFIMLSGVLMMLFSSEINSLIQAIPFGRPY